MPLFRFLFSAGRITETELKSASFTKSMTVGFILRKTATLLITLLSQHAQWIASVLVEKTGITLMKTRACRKELGSIFRGRSFMKFDVRAMSRFPGSNGTPQRWRKKTGFVYCLKISSDFHLRS